MPPSFYRASLNSPLTAGGSETTVNVNTLTTLNGETVTWAEFSPFTRGILVVDPESQAGTLPEIISFTGVDSTNIAFTGATRGLSAVGSGTVTANKVYHGTNTPVIISWGAQNITDLLAYINSLITGVAGNASSTVAGVTKLSLNPVTPTSPIAVGDNDTRVPTVASNAYLTSINGYLLNYYADTGTANAYAITPSPVISSYVAGQTFIFKAANANTTASTLNVNSLGVKSIKKMGSSALVSGDIASGSDVMVTYDGTNFQMISPVANLPSAPGVSSGNANHDISSNSAQTIAHGLSTTPRLVKVTVTLAGNPSASAAFLTYSGGAANVIRVVSSGTSSVADNTGHIFSAISGPTGTTVGIGAPDATNINLTWSKDTASTGTAYILWEAYA